MRKNKSVQINTVCKQFGITPDQLKDLQELKEKFEKKGKN